MPVRGTARSRVKVLRKILRKRRRQASVAVVLWFRQRDGGDSASTRSGRDRCLSSFPPLAIDQDAIAESTAPLPSL
jgi:hypothetical protein